MLIYLSSLHVAIYSSQGQQTDLCNYFPAVLKMWSFLGSVDDIQQHLKWTDRTNSNTNVPAGTMLYIFQRK